MMTTGTYREQGKIRVGRFTLEVLEFTNGLKEIAIQRESGEFGLFNYTKFEDTIDLFFEENF